MYACCDVHLGYKCITYFLGLFVTKFISAIQSLRLVDIPLMFVSHALSLLPATPLIDSDTLALIRSESLLYRSFCRCYGRMLLCSFSVCMSSKVTISLVPRPFFLHIRRESDARSIWVMFLVTWEGRGVGGGGGGGGAGGVAIEWICKQQSNCRESVICAFDLCLIFVL